jgi:hypothetical protein
MENTRNKQCAACARDAHITKTNVCDPCHAKFALGRGRRGLAIKRIVRENQLYCLKCLYVVTMDSVRRGGRVKANCYSCANDVKKKRKREVDTEQSKIDDETAAARAREIAEAREASRTRLATALSAPQYFSNEQLTVMQYGSMMQLPHLLEPLGVSVPMPPIPVYRPVYQPHVPIYDPRMYCDMPGQMIPVRERLVSVRLTFMMNR